MQVSNFLSDWWGSNCQLMFRIKGTVILKIWAQLLFVILYSTAVVGVHFFVPQMEIVVPQTLVPILGLVIGLLLVFRTNTAYDRYYEGRRIWSMMTYNIRVLTRCFWLGVRETGSSKELIEKTTAINLLIGFAYATKNYLREEYSYDSDNEMKELISHIPKFKTPSSLQPGVSQPQYAHPDINRHQQPKSSNEKNGTEKPEIVITIDENESVEPKKASKGGSTKRLRLPITMSTRRKCALAVRDSKQESFTRRDNIYMAHDYVKPTNIPLELAYYIDSYTYYVQSKKTVENETFKVMLACKMFAIKNSFKEECFPTAVNNLIDALTQFERILRTPIPLAYSVHLHHSIWLYLLSLPFQLMGKLGWATIPLIAFATFALLGILAIGWEIENPFGYDDNDLPLDDFCEVIRQEIQMIIKHEVPKPESWTFTPENHPFIPKCSESALELNEKSIEQLREILFSQSSEYGRWNPGFKP